MGLKLSCLQLIFEEDVNNDVNDDVNDGQKSSFKLNLSHYLHLPQKSIVNMKVLTPVKNDVSF